MDELILSVCRKEGLKALRVEPMTAGQVNQVYRVDERYLVRIGQREDAHQRLKQEAALLRQMAGKLPVPEVLAFGQIEGATYQIQGFIPGQMLLRVWPTLDAETQDRLVGELADCLLAFSQMRYPAFGSFHENSPAFERWPAYLEGKFRSTLAEMRALRIATQPGFIELAEEYFERHLPALEGGVPCLVHSDLAFGNILVEKGHIAAILDFEYALKAPADYELSAIEDFCLYPNDYAEEDNEIYRTSDFAGFGQLLRRHAPGLFEVPRLSERLSLYHLVAAFSSHLAWRKDHLAAIPPEIPKAKEFYMARITNSIFRHGARIF